MLKTIFFDFDGVILESAGIKTEAFRKLFSNYPKHVDEIVKYHEDNAGVSRYDKFDYIYGDILKEKLTEAKKSELGKQFSELVLKEIERCPFVIGTIEFLEAYSKKLNLFVASATPDEELKYLIKKRGLSGYFSGVYGAPAKKSEIILTVISNKRLNKEESIFIGDTMADYEHSVKAGVSFIGRVPDGENPFPPDIKTVRDLNEFSGVVEELL